MNHSQFQARNNKFDNRFNALRKFIKFDIIKYATTKSRKSTDPEIKHQRFVAKAKELLWKIEDVYDHPSFSNLKKEVFICLDLAKKCKENNFQNLIELKIKSNQTLKILDQTQQEISEEMNRTNWVPLIIILLIIVIGVIGGSIFLANHR